MRSDVLNDSSNAFLNETVISPNHTEIHVADVTLNAVQDVGGVHIMKAADKTFTLPAVATGAQYTLVLGIDLGASEYMRIDPDGSDKFVGGGNNGAVYKADNWKHIGFTAGLPEHKSSSMKWDNKDKLKNLFVKPTGENKKMIFIKEIK